MTDILLATAQVNVLGVDGTYKTMRALIDQGSQTSIISENAAQQLGIHRRRCKGSIFGIGAKESNCKGVMTITIASKHNEFTMNIDVLIMKTLINKLPNQSFTKPSWQFLENIQFADPEFNQSRPVDLLLGAEVYSEIILHGIIKEDQSLPIAQQTQLGWILCGNVRSYYCNVVLNNCDDIKRFWEIEDLTEQPDNQSREDLYCIQQYQTETKRQPDGRYVVRLPMKPEVKELLGESKSKAIAQFHQLERKFGKNSQIAADYKQFMNEYFNLGHMKLSHNNQPIEYFLPHHCVIRSESTTSAIRVVFNGSAKTSTGHSVNDLMYSGPNLQLDLLSVIIKWRQYKVGYVADAEKMFRQINLNEEDQQYQKIIWRDSPNNPLSQYQLTTVTYGTKAAPFLALMTMKQLDKDKTEAAKVLENNLYMDDVLHGQHNLESAKKIKGQLIELFNAGGFNLRKWKSNETDHADIRWELKTIGDKIDQVKNNTKPNLEDEESFNYHDVHHYIAIYVLAGAILLTCLAYGVRRIRARVQPRAEALPPPQPQPRTRHIADHQYHSENNPCFSVSDEYNSVNNHPSTSATNHLYARVNKVKHPNSFSFGVVE
ncbi:uncharacterized protein LOC113500191 [Trichoplusia ni]|uniref:Uncharacterized protein LOC113500191 n=1 Tax=Trichoplusia ni TaxID=7111 RepID=A0A7E5W872_TRINI|nr:uncharacterized protein LOC113500191 [Trichoplusia ni]